MTYRTCLIQFAHISVFVSQNPVQFFFCVCVLRWIGREERKTKRRIIRGMVKFKQFPIMTTSCERHEQDKCFD